MFVMSHNKELLELCDSIIAKLESAYSKAELLGDCPWKDLYLEARKARYNLVHWHDQP